MQPKIALWIVQNSRVFDVILREPLFRGTGSGLRQLLRRRAKKCLQTSHFPSLSHLLYTLIANSLDSCIELREVAKANCGAKKRIISKHEVRSESFQMWKNEITQYPLVRAFHRTN